MSLKPKTFSILICRKGSAPYDEINFLLKIAWHYAHQGWLVFILSREIFDTTSDIDLSPFTSNPEILNRIIFRYFSESSDLLDWCHQIHNHSRIPRLFLLNGLEKFSPINEFSAVEICAALLDCVQYCSRFNENNMTYLLTTVGNIKNTTCLTSFVTFFDKIWSLENVQQDIYWFSQIFPSIPNLTQQKFNIKI